MLAYLINVSITWTVLYLIYKVFLEREKYFKLNRFYLLCSLVLGLLLPLISYIPITQANVIPAITSDLNQAYHSQIAVVTAYSEQIELTSSALRSKGSPEVSWVGIFKLIYLLGLGIVLVKMALSILSLVHIFKHSEIIKTKTHTEIITSEKILPFSFLKFIIIQKQGYNEIDRKNILNHELFHVRSYHTLDVLFVEILKIIFWWHPLVYVYKKSISENHEYAADHAALATTSLKQYCELLMTATFPGVNLNLANPFFQTFVKKRILMMYQEKSSYRNLLKYGIALVAVVFMAAIFVKPLVAKSDSSSESVWSKIVKNPERINKSSFEKAIVEKNEMIDAKVLEKSTVDKNAEKGTGEDSFLEAESPQKDELDWWTSNCKMNKHFVFYELDEFSRLPSCPTDEDAWQHARNTLSRFAQENFIWPKQALEEGEERMITYDLTINEEGDLTDILPTDFNLEHPYHFGLEEESKRLIDLMRAQFKFIPGKCNGTIVTTGTSFSFFAKIPKNKRHLVKVKNSRNTIPKQKFFIKSICNSGSMNIEYVSNMNVGVSFEVTDPNGEVIFTDAIEQIYSKYQTRIPLLNKENGVYKIRSIQDGLEELVEVDIDVFNEHNTMDTKLIAKEF